MKSFGSFHLRDMQEIICRRIGFPSCHDHHPSTCCGAQSLCEEAASYYLLAWLSCHSLQIRILVNLKVWVCPLAFWVVGQQT